MNIIINSFKQYGDFKGNATRQEFVLFIFFALFMQIICFSIDLYFNLEIPNIIKGIVFYPLFELSRLVLLLPSVSLTIRRLNAINRSKWWVLLLFTLVGLIPLFYWCYFKKNNTLKYN